MSAFFTDTMTGLLQAVAIEKGEIPVVEIKGMPSKTYRNIENVSKDTEKEALTNTRVHPEMREILPAGEASLI